MIDMDGDVLVYREEPLPLWLRFFAVVLGFGVAIVIPTPFIIHNDWSTFSPTFLLAVVCIVIPPALGGFFVFVGLASASEFTIDPVSKVVVRRLRGPVVNRTDRFPLKLVELPEVFMRKSEDEGTYPILRLRLPRGKMDISCFADKAEADAWADQIRRILQS